MHTRDPSSSYPRQFVPHTVRTPNFFRLNKFKTVVLFTLQPIDIYRLIHDSHIVLYIYIRTYVLTYVHMYMHVCMRRPSRTSLWPKIYFLSQRSCADLELIINDLKLTRTNPAAYVFYDTPSASRSRRKCASDNWLWIHLLSNIVYDQPPYSEWRHAMFPFFSHKGHIYLFAHGYC